MKILKITLLSLLGILVLVLLISLFLPAEVKMERSIYIQSKPKHVFALINDLKAWKQWSPWYKKDTAAKYTYSEITEGGGAFFTWDSQNEQVGKGKTTITASIPFEKIATSLEMGFGATTADFLLTQTGDSVKLTWTFHETEQGLKWYFIPMSRYFNLFLEDMLSPDYLAGLASIKALAEQTTELYIGGFEAEMRDFGGLNYIGIRNQLKLEEIGPKLGENYALLTETIKSNAAKQIGPPFTINYSAKGNVYDMEACLGTDAALSPAFPIVPGKLKPGKQLVIKYYGAYEKMGNLYGEAFKYIFQNNLKASGPPLEFYITDPIAEPDTAKWLTELVFPVIE